MNLSLNEKNEYAVKGLSPNEYYILSTLKFLGYERY